MKVSIIIRSFNEEKHIGKLLHEIDKQKVSFDYEIILVDSGSTDKTVEIAKSYNVNVVHISPEDFTFGYSLNIGIAEASGDVCALISAHCYPAVHDWLHEMVAPFHDKKVALVYGRQIGTETSAYSEHRIFHRWFPDYDIDDGDLAFCNNANSAIRRSVWEGYKFDEQLSGLEDLDWARHVKNNGHKTSYSSKATVFHVHNESSKQIYNRYYREALAYRQIYKNEHFNFLDFVKFFILNIFGDYLHAIRDKVFFKNLFSIVHFRFLQFWATYRAHKYRTSINRAMKRRLYYPDRPNFFNDKKRTVSKLDNEERSPSRYIDITKEVSERIAVWPGAPRFEKKDVKKFEEHGYRDTSFFINAHCGTHVDAPSHFLADGKNLSEMRLEQFCGRAFLINYTGEKHIPAAFLENVMLPKGVTKLLFKTRNSQMSVEEFDRDFVALSLDGAQWCVDHKIDLVGIDGPSIQGFHDKNPVHQVLMKDDILILENLDLLSVKTGEYELISLPMKIEKMEASPIRAILKEV